MDKRYFFAPDRVKAGRELDALVADKVMGLEVLGTALVDNDPECSLYFLIPFDGRPGEGAFESPVYLDGCMCEFKEKEDTNYYGHIAGCLEVVPFYSTDIAAAWEVLKKAAADSTTSLNVYRVDYEGEPWQCIFVWVDGEWYQKAGGSASTAPLAICRAALKVINTVNNANNDCGT